MQPGSDIEFELTKRIIYRTCALDSLGRPVKGRKKPITCIINFYTVEFIELITD